MRATQLKTVVGVCVATLLLFSASAARAQSSPDEIAEGINAKMRGGLDPASAVLHAFAEAGDFRFDGQQIEQLVDVLGCPKEGLAGVLLSGVKSFEKKGDRITIRKNSGGRLALEGQDGKGWVHWNDTIKFRIRNDGKGVKADKFDGLSVSESEDSTKAGIWNLDLAPNAAKDQVLKMTAGVFLFSKTVEVNLSKVFREAKAREEAAGREASSAGISGVLGGASRNE